ncbi:hypothetical protein OVY01_20945 [Robbsia sp. Bb-Pol-6]|uniref:Uncharacterized protein n=1 Tax=Robbsia betulipollinis TaxID=2981849 RepID=A0ABT3ZSW3_9BURK|nr:hypothetical protein [Robbsia betulipollinis]MCY0389618.1 hypothetical protein [Robbsia betulipollinis]
MTITSVLQRIASWFKSKEAAVVATVEADVTKIVGAHAAAVPTVILKEIAMPDATIPATVDKVGAAVQIALLLKSVDASLTTEQVQAATAAALSAAYPAA